VKKKAENRKRENFLGKLLGGESRWGNPCANTGVNFINILCTNFSYKHHFGSFFYVHVTREKLLKRR